MIRIVVAICVLPLLILAGCDRLDPSYRSASINATTLEGKVRGRRAGGEEMRVWRDPETGCQYLLWEGRRRGGVTPRLSTTGQPICRS